MIICFHDGDDYRDDYRPEILIMIIDDDDYRPEIWLRVEIACCVHTEKHGGYPTITYYMGKSIYTMKSQFSNLSH